MKKEIRGSFWWWLLLAVIFAGIGGYLIVSYSGQKTQKRPEGKNLSPVETKAPRQKQPETTKEKRGVPAKAAPEEDNCTKTQKDLAEFFHYLDGKSYIRRLKLGMSVKARFKKIVKRLSTHPPSPAGEGIDPGLIIRNAYHFFRVLHKKDRRLTKEIIIHEGESPELDLAMFYTWLAAGDRCPDKEGLRPSFKVIYRYAGFFLNTIGGRAYVFRRPTVSRLLITYYSLLFMHEADKAEKNYYGIDIFPYIAPLKKEIDHYPDLQLQKEYLKRLNEMETYYLQKR